MRWSVILPARSATWARGRPAGGGSASSSPSSGPPGGPVRLASSVVVLLAPPQPGGVNRTFLLCANRTLSFCGDKLQRSQRRRGADSQSAGPRLSGNPASQVHTAAQQAEYNSAADYKSAPQRSRNQSWARNGNSARSLAPSGRLPGARHGGAATLFLP